MGKESIDREFSRLKKESGIAAPAGATLTEYRKNLKQIARALEQKEAEDALNRRIESGEHALADEEMPEFDVTDTPTSKRLKRSDNELRAQEAPKKKSVEAPKDKSQEPDLFSHNQE